MANGNRSKSQRKTVAQLATELDEFETRISGEIGKLSQAFAALQKQIGEWQEKDLDRDNRLERFRDELRGELDTLKSIVHITARQHTEAPRPRDVIGAPTGSALLEPRANWRPGRRSRR